MEKKTLYLLCSAVQLSALNLMAEENNLQLTGCTEFEGQDTGDLIPNKVLGENEEKLSEFMAQASSTMRGVRFYTSKTYTELKPIPQVNADRGAIEPKKSKK